jgi:glutathione S-transferase
MSGAGVTATMLTFQPMIDSETARLVARHYGIAVTERDHLLVCASLRTLLRGGYGRIPLLVGQGFALTGPYPIAEHFDAALPAARRLIPTTPPLAAEVAADWARYNGAMGSDVAVVAYYRLLPQRALMQPIFAAPVPWLEARLLPLTYPILRGLITLALGLSADRAAAATLRIRAAFDATDRRIADGRRYLAGERLTIGDIALCAAAAPLLLPRGYGALMPPLAAMPPALRTLMEELRTRPTAAFVQRLYDSGFVAG